MVDENLPEWLAEQGDGSVSITLARGVEVDGVRVMEVRMREPTVDDQLLASAGTSDAAMREVTLVANLLDVPPDAVRKATLRDYGRLQEALGFLAG